MTITSSLHFFLVQIICTKQKVYNQHWPGVGYYKNTVGILRANSLI